MMGAIGNKDSFHLNSPIGTESNLARLIFSTFAVKVFAMWDITSSGTRTIVASI